MLEAEHRTKPELDRSVILLDQIVEVFRCSGSGRRRSSPSKTLFGRMHPDRPRRACAAVRPRRPCGKAQRVQDGFWIAGYLGDVGLIITKIWCWYQFWKRAGRGLRRCRVGDRHRHRHSSECQRASRSVVGAFSPESRRLQFCRPSEFGRALPGRFRPVGRREGYEAVPTRLARKASPISSLVNGHSSGGPAPKHRRRRP
jgi:hypothetical protein